MLVTDCKCGSHKHWGMVRVNIIMIKLGHISTALDFIVPPAVRYPTTQERLLIFTTPSFLSTIDDGAEVFAAGSLMIIEESDYLTTFRTILDISTAGEGSRRTTVVEIPKTVRASAGCFEHSSHQMFCC